MNSLVQEIIGGLLPEAEGKRKVVAVYGGGFKPPTEGHFAVVKQALEENPEIDEFIIFIGTKDRDGLTKADALLIWEIYNKYLPYKVKIDPSDKSPIQSIYNYAKEHPEEEVLFVIGARENNEEDFKDIALRTRSMDKYPNLELRTIVTKTAASGTAARNAAKVSFEKFRPFLPAELTDEEAKEVFDIVSQNIQEELLLENASYRDHIDYKSKIKELTQHMLDKGMNIKPLPKVIFKNGDAENAKNFFGRTAYYDPNNKTVVLYTEGRHPKDIVRSFAHEMIHHIQNLEGRLGDITTTNTQEDDSLNKIEQEANLKGTMTFRNWTDSLNEAIVGDKIVCDNCGWSWDIKDGGDDLFLCHKCDHDNTPIKENKVKDPFGINAYAMELANLREEEGQYKVYLDMDGVLADFDQRFRGLADMEPKEFEEKYGKNAFWNFIDEEHKIKFWVGIPVMPGAKELVDYVRPYNYEILSAPSMKKQSRLGKILWVKNHTADVFGSKPIINFRQAKEKHKIKPELSQFDILVDDRADTIDRWNAAGGTGILYTSAGQTINALKKLGL